MKFGLTIPVTIGKNWKNKLLNALPLIEDAAQSLDGTYNGKMMAASDYWFKIELENNEIKSGHFTLKR